MNLSYTQRRALLEKLTNYLGRSASDPLVGCLLLIGYTLDEIEAFVRETE